MKYKGLETLKFNNLPYPKFLAFNYDGFDYSFNDKNLKSIKPDSFYKEKLLKEFSGENTVIIFNGRVIFNNVKNADIHSLISDKTLFAEYMQSDSNNKLDFLNKSYLNSAVQIRFNDGLLSENIKIIISASHNLAHYSNYIVSENCNATVVEEFVLFNNSKLNYVLNSTAEKDSNLRLVYLEHFKNSSSNYIAHNIKVLDNAKADLYYLNIISANNICVSEVNLLGRYAECTINSVSFVNKTYKNGILQNAKHLNKNTKSLINNIAIVNNNATMVIDGLNTIEKGFSKSEAGQESRIVNLSDEAKSVANPQLIINEYDVKAGHAAAVGRLDEDQLYYLMSRGLTKQQSIELLVDGFVNEIFEIINNRNTISKLKKNIKSKII